MYGCESWTLKKAEETRINAFEMKCLRRVLRIPWTAKKTNEWALETAGLEKKLLKSVKKLKLAYYGHIMRKQKTCLEKEMIQGTISGSRVKKDRRWTIAIFQKTTTQSTTSY